MTPQHALAVTSGCLLFASMIVGLMAQDATHRTARRMAATAWTAFALSLLGFAGTAWWEALS